jgi:predicted nucleotidyltransferase
MNILEEDSMAIIRALYKRDVSFILVGGLAVIYHGYGRTTGDIDIWIEDSTDNREKFAAALNDYGIEGSEIYLDLPINAGFSEIMLDSGIYLDLMANLVQYSQAEYHKCYEMCNDWEPELGIHVKVLSLNQLIHEKEKNTRLKDQDDAENLKRIRSINS